MASDDAAVKYVNAAMAALKDSAIPPTEAAATIAASCAGECEANAAKGEAVSSEGDTPGLEGFLWGFFDQAIHLATEDPSTHPRITSVLRELKAIGRRGCEGMKIWGNEFDWANLPLFGASAREGLYVFVQEQPSGEILSGSTEEAWALLSTDAVPDPNDTKAVAYARGRARWIIMNRFFMRAWADDVFDFSLYAIWALRDGLEGLDLNAPDPVDPAAIGPRPLAIETAAAYVEEAPEVLFNCRKIFSDASDRGGKRWTGVDGFHPDRWALWKTAFGEIAENNGQYKLPDHAVAAAKRALAAMEKAETSN